MDRSKRKKLRKLVVRKKKNMSTQKKNTSTQKRNTSIQKKNTSTQKKNTSTQKKNTSTQKKNTSTQIKNTSTQKKNTSTQKKNTSTQKKNTSTQKKNTSTQKKKEMTVQKTEYAIIPECQDRSYADKEYTTSREEKLWDPAVDVEEWFPSYTMVARTLLTLKQEHEGTPNADAMENSCSGDAEQYIRDVLHDSEYDPYDALRMISTKDIPHKIVDKWKPKEMQLFTEGIMKHRKNFSIIRSKMLPHKRVVDFANFYYVWKRSSMAEAWNKSRAEIKAEEKEMKKELLKKKRLRNQSTNEPPCDLSNKRRKTRKATAAAKRSLQNGKRADDDSKSSTSTSPSEKDEETSAESTDSSKEHVQKTENGLSEAATSEKSPMKNEQISDNSMKCPKQRNKRKLSIPCKIVNFEQESADKIEEIKIVPAPIIPQWKRQRSL